MPEGNSGGSIGGNCYPASEVPHVVYALGKGPEPAHFLEVVPPDENVNEVVDKWWHAFDSGEKEQPKNYSGVNHRPVPGFENWPEGDRNGR